MLIRDSIGHSELNRPIWRYLNKIKFDDLINTHAIWLARLDTLLKIDALEGTIPTPALSKMNSKVASFKKHFKPELHDQLDQMAKRNVEDGQYLTVAQCWFLGDEEMPHMWDRFVGDSAQGVAIKSTITRLLSSITARQLQDFQIGKVDYVDMTNYDMDLYKANQAVERAFLKDLRFKDEHELRLTAINLRVPECIDENGKTLTAIDCQGLGRNNYDRLGLKVGTNLDVLVESLVLHPNSTEEFSNYVKTAISKQNLNLAVTQSTLAVS